MMTTPIRDRLESPCKPKGKKKNKIIIASITAQISDN
jgi:hypothetical protein